MQRGKKIAAATVMLGLGLAFAMLFRRTAPPAAESPPTQPLPQKEALVLRESSADLPGRTLSEQVVPLKPAPGAKPPRDLEAPMAAPQKPVAPPDLPAIFDRSLSTMSSQDPRGVEALAKLDAHSSAATAIPQGPPPPRIHKIVDGDTLAYLAERFLGDASRGAEIFELNAGRLSDPNLLPIGVELQIPPREGGVAVRVNRPLLPQSSYPAAASPLPPLSDTTGLAPVPAGLPRE